MNSYNNFLKIKFQKKMKRSILTLAFLLVASTIFFTGCSDNGTGGGVVVNQNVKVFRNLVVAQFNTGASMSGVNLFTGQVVRADNNMKDIHLSDSNSTGANFFFRSGDLGLDEHGNLVILDALAGDETKFGATISYSSVTQSQFDTLKVIPSFTNVSNPGGFFLNDRTDNYDNPKFFNAPLTHNTVYSFWLKGKSSILPNDVYGVLYLKSARYNPGNGDFEVTIDVKINTAGQNDFRETIAS
jgi:hypothetical protein